MGQLLIGTCVFTHMFTTCIHEQGGPMELRPHPRGERAAGLCCSGESPRLLSRFKGVVLLAIHALSPGLKLSILSKDLARTSTFCHSDYLADTIFKDIDL